jgi:RNA polymerase sigma factor (sigma-70 family)
MAAAFSQIQRGMFRGDSGLGTWLEAIVHGKITDYQRSPGKRPLPSQNSGSDQDGRSREIEPLLVTRPRTEQVLAVREILHRLPRNHRVILTLNKVGGYTTAEIGRRLRWPSGTVGRVLAEAQQTFRELYVESEEFPASQRQSIGDGNG